MHAHDPKDQRKREHKEKQSEGPAGDLAGPHTQDGSTR